MKKNDLLLVIDMQNVYLPGEEWACPSMPEAIRNIRALLDADVAERVIFTRFVPPDPAVGTWKAYNEENAAVNASTYLNEMVSELQPFMRKWPVCGKSIYSSCRIPEVAEAMKHADRLVLAGVVAECCVLATMMEAIDCGYKTVFLTDCISGQSEQNEMCIRRIAESFAPVHTEVMDVRSYLEEE